MGVALSVLGICLSAATVPTSMPEVVDVGLYMHHIPEIDVKSNTYVADFYLWFRWKGPIDPTRSFEFTNIVDPSALQRTPVFIDAAGNSAPEQLADGVLYQQFHIQGRFTHSFALQEYPLDRQQVVIEIEDVQHQSHEIIYRVDEVGKSGVHPQLTLSGWQVEGILASVVNAHYDTNFGDPRVKANNELYTHFTFGLQIHRPVWGYLVKTLIPILIVLLITFLIFLIDSDYFEGRLGLGITTLISAVALQLTTTSDLPSVGYVVLIDKIYNISYAVIFVSLVESVAAVRMTDGGNDAASKRLDRVTLIVTLMASFVAAGIIFLVH